MNKYGNKKITVDGMTFDLIYQAQNEVRSDSIRKDKEIRQAPVERGVRISRNKNKHRDWRK